MEDYKSNYYIIDSNIEETDPGKTLFFNFQRILSSDLTRDDWTFAGNKLGMGYRINNNDDTKKNVRFDGVDYECKNFNITSHFDVINESPDQDDFGIVLELESPQMRKMYIQIKLERVPGEDIQGELDVLIAKADDDNDADRAALDISLDDVAEPEKNPITLGELFINEWFLNVKDFYHYSKNNVIYVYIDTPPIKVRDFTMDLISAGEGPGREGRFGNTPSLFNRTSVPSDIVLQRSSNIKQFDIGDITFEDIYIDCSPEDYDENNRIINPKKVYTVKPLFGSEQYGKISGELSTILFAVIVFALIFLLFNYNISMLNPNEISTKITGGKFFLKYSIIIGIILIGVFTILFIGKATDGLKEKFIFNISLLAILAIISATVIILIWVFIYFIDNDRFGDIKKGLGFIDPIITRLSGDNKYIYFLLYFLLVFIFVTILVMIWFGLLSIVGIKFKASVYLLSCLFFTVIIFGTKILNIVPNKN